MKKYFIFILFFHSFILCYSQDGFIIPNCRIWDLITVHENKSLVLCWRDYPDTTVNNLLLISKDWEIEKEIEITHPTGEWEYAQALAFDTISQNIYIPSNYRLGGFNGDYYFRHQTFNNKLEQVWDTSFY